MSDDGAPKEINNCEDLRQAIATVKPGDKAEQRYLMKKGIDLGCVNDIPDDWEMEVNAE